MRTRLPIALLLAYPVVAVMRVRIRQRRHKPGHCIKCEYDLTGNTSGICPECGTERRRDIVVVLSDGRLEGIYSSRGHVDGTVIVRDGGADASPPVVWGDATSTANLPANIRKSLDPQGEFKRKADEARQKRTG